MVQVKRQPRGVLSQPVVQARAVTDLAEAFRPAAEILIIGNGKGHGTGMLQFVQYLAEHDQELMKRMVGSVETDDEDLTKAKILALARDS